MLASNGRFADANVDAIATATDTLLGGALSAEFQPVIFSKVRGKAYGIESVQVDNVPDVIRSRRVNESTHTKRFPAVP